MTRGIVKLGTIVFDTVSKVEGMLTMACIDMDDNENYLFQPSSLNPETRQPSDKLWLTKSRLTGTSIDVVDLPLHVLGTECRDKATGFHGKAISLNYHINGCVHLDIKPEGLIEKTGCTIPAHEFDIRRLEGEFIKELSPKELKESKEKRPSPEFTVPKSNR